MYAVHWPDWVTVAAVLAVIRELVALAKEILS